MGKAVGHAEKAGIETEEKSNKATHVARPKTGGGGEKRPSDADVNEGRVKGELTIEGNMEGASCKAIDMTDQEREKKKQVINDEEKTHENRTNTFQEKKSEKSNNRKRRYKALALAVKRHLETSEERMKKQNHFFSSVSSNLDKIDLLLGRID